MVTNRNKIREKILKFEYIGIALASQIEDLQTVVELAKCVAKYYIRKKEVGFFYIKSVSLLSKIPFQSIVNYMSNIPNLLMKRVMIMKGYCDLIYDFMNSTIQFVEQQRIFLENFQKRMHQYWTASSSNTDSDETRMESTSSPSTTETH